MCFLWGYEPGFYIPDDGILHNHRRGNLESYIVTHSDCKQLCTVMGWVRQYSELAAGALWKHTMRSHTFRMDLAYLVLSNSACQPHILACPPLTGTTQYRAVQFRRICNSMLVHGTRAKHGTTYGTNMSPGRGNIYIGRALPATVLPLRRASLCSPLSSIHEFNLGPAGRCVLRENIFGSVDASVNRN
jgi:hypothetical protein